MFTTRLTTTIGRHRRQLFTAAVDVADSLRNSEAGQTEYQVYSGLNQMHADPDCPRTQVTNPPALPPLQYYKLLQVNACNCLRITIPAPDGTIHPDRTRHLQMVAATAGLRNLAELVGSHLSQHTDEFVSELLWLHHQLPRLCQHVHPDAQPQLTDLARPLADPIRAATRELQPATYGTDSWCRKTLAAHADSTFDRWAHRLHRHVNQPPHNIVIIDLPANLTQSAPTIPTLDHWKTWLHIGRTAMQLQQHATDHHTHRNRMLAILPPHADRLIETIAANPKIRCSNTPLPADIHTQLLQPDTSSNPQLQPDTTQAVLGSHTHDTNLADHLTAVCTALH